MKKQVKKLSNKILVLGLATSIIFTSCFSYKKINAHATSVVAGLGAYTLYEICLYIGGLAVTTLGIGYAYENRDEIAEFGKSVIDSMSDLGSSAWVLGSHTTDGDYVYGTEALQEVKDTEWTVIQGGGQSPKNDNDDDGDEDLDDREIELNLNGYFLTSAGVSLFENHIKPIYENWVNDADTDIVNPSLGITNYNDHVFENMYAAFGQWYDLDHEAMVSQISAGKPYMFFDGYYLTEDGYYFGYYYLYSEYKGKGHTEKHYIFSDQPVTFAMIKNYNTGYYEYGFQTNSTNCFSEDPSLLNWGLQEWEDRNCHIETNLPILTTFDQLSAFSSSGYIQGVTDQASKYYRIADWIAEDDAWKGHLEDIATSLRSLQGLSNIAQEFANNILEYKPTVNIAGDTLNDYITNQYSPITNIYITNPTYYPASNTTPKLDISVFPNYDIYIENGGGNEEPPSDDVPEEIPEIDLDGLLSIFNILFYLIMIIVMLIYLFLSCLAFIVMIFRIPASPSMLPEDMVLGYEHLKTIMIPGMNISIYGFAMALIYLFIIFAVIKLIRLEINDFKFPRSYK